MMELSIFKGICSSILILFVTGIVLSRAEDVDENCRFGHWKCLNSSKCIPLSWKCDSDVDCGHEDHSDEQNCPPKTCADQEFSCIANGQCIPERWKCDGEKDCENGEDESEKTCANTGGCPAEEFSCGDGNCISTKWMCDGVADCENGNDEANCTKTCETEMFTCHDGQCISNSWVCDGDHDCLDESDEAHCPDKTCKGDEFKCDDASRCIDIKWRCDGDFDCPDHSDETNNCTATNIEDPEICSPKTEFKCLTSGECIHKSWQCDGDPDCTDSSDEDHTCNYTCRADQFKCTNHVCISLTLQCDGNDDCIDRSDELNCTRPNCDQLGEFDCYGDGSLCIPKEKVCDGRNDCQHMEDEDSALCKHKNPCLNHKCPENSKCENKPYPNNTMLAECVCSAGYQFEKDTGLCKDIDECVDRSMCSQICTNTKGGYKCGCRDGYILEKHYFCRAQGEQPWLYYANRRDIRRLRADSRYMEIIVEDTSNSIALDIDYEDGLMFWTDGGLEQIKRAKVGGHGILAVEEFIVISNDGKAAFSTDGIAVDWLYKNIYWTNSGTDTIKVANYDGSKSKVLIWTGLDDPRAICVDPENGYMYWTDWGQDPKIERSGMDGNNREVIVKGGDDLQWPNGLTIDYVEGRIYWIDSKLHKIGTAKLDGSEKSHVLVDAMEIRRPFSIAVFEDTLYWTDWHTNSIRSVHKVTGRNPKTLSIGSYSVMDIKVYHEQRQEKRFKNAAKALCEAARCEFMCLPAAKVTVNATVSCVCGDNQILDADKRTCAAAPATQQPPTTQKSAPETTQKPTTQKPSETTQKPGSAKPGAPVTDTPGGYTRVSEETTPVGAPGKQESNATGSIAAIAATVVAVIFIIITVVGCIIFRRYRSRNKKSMNFDNPVYRKTTTSDDHEHCIGRHDEPQMEPLTARHESV